MGLKTVRIVYDKKYEDLLKPHLNKVCYKGYDSNAKYIKVIVLGTMLKQMGINSVGNSHNPIKVKLNYQYNLYLYGSEQDLEKDTNQAGLKAKRLIRKLVNRPLEPFEPNIERPRDFIISNDFKTNTDYTGYWIDIDMNSAEPYYVSQVLPELKNTIYKRYSIRKSFPINKLILNAINGNLRNMYVSKYKEVVNLLFNKMGWLWDELNKYGIRPFALRRDGIVALLPYENCPLPDTINISDKIGDFKIKYDYGTIRTTTSNYVYQTDMTIIGSKTTGTILERYLDRLHIVCYGNIGLIIKED